MHPPGNALETAPWLLLGAVYTSLLALRVYVFPRMCFETRAHRLLTAILFLSSLFPLQSIVWRVCASCSILLLGSVSYNSVPQPPHKAVS